MSNDEKTEAKPPEPPTVKLDKDEITRQLLDKVLLKLTEVGDGQDEFRTGLVVVRDGLTSLGGKVDALVSSHTSVANDVEALKGEQMQTRERLGAIDERFNSHSMRAKQESVHDGAQDMKLQELENRLAAQAESSMRAILAEVKTAATVVAKTPLGKRVLQAAGYAALAFFGFATLYFGAMTARLQQQPPTVVQLAPDHITDAGVDR